MFDWPVAAVFISTLATLAVAIAKFVPRRGGPGGPGGPASLANGTELRGAPGVSTDARLVKIETRLGSVEQNLAAARLEHREDMKELRELFGRRIDL